MFTERLSQLAQRVENFEHEADGGTNLNEVITY